MFRQLLKIKRTRSWNLSTFRSIFVPHLTLYCSLRIRDEEKEELLRMIDTSYGDLSASEDEQN
jgi:hypothetical protein